MTFSGFSFSEAPFSGSLNSYSLICEAGSYALNGQSASFAYVKTLPAGAGSYAITGNPAGLNNDKVLQGNAGSYTFTGNDARLLCNKVLTANSGSYALTGNNATFAHSQVIYAGAFSFQMTGQSASLCHSRLFAAEPGAYQLTGKNAGLHQSKLLRANHGSYEFIGYSADLVYSGQPAVVVPSKGGIGKKKSKRDAEREQREELEAIVKREFDILDGTFTPEAVESVKQAIIPELKQINWAEYQIALAQVNTLLLKAKIQIAEYESELDDEEALLMLL